MFLNDLREDILSVFQNSCGRGVPSRSKEISARRQLATTRYPCRLACQRAFSGRTLGAPGKETPPPSPRIAWISRRAGRRQVHASPVRVTRTERALSPTLASRNRTRTLRRAQGRLWGTSPFYRTRQVRSTVANQMRFSYRPSLRHSRSPISCTKSPSGCERNPADSRGSRLQWSAWMSTSILATLPQCRHFGNRWFPGFASACVGFSPFDERGARVICTTPPRSTRRAFFANSESNTPTQP